MNLESLKNCHAQALPLARRLRLPLRSRVWKGQSGEFSGGGTGSSLDFHDHRGYAPGDDPRHINWQAYARTGSYTMKLFREEVRPVVEVVIDVSDSMFFTPAKAIRTAELFYLITESAQAAGASLAVHAVKGERHLSLDPTVLRTHCWYEVVSALAPAHPAQAPEISRLSLRSNAVRIFLSDLLFPGDPGLFLRHLGQGRGSAIIFSPFLQEEEDPGWSGNYEFIDTEEKTQHPHRIEPAVLKRYRESYQRHFTWWNEQARRQQVVLARIPCEEDLAAVLLREAVRCGALEAG